MRITKQLLVLAIAASALSSQMAKATSLLSESFNGLNTAALGGQNSWTAGGNFQVSSGGLNYNNGSLTINGGTKSVKVSAWASAQRMAKGFGTQSGPLYMSFLYQNNNLASTTATAQDNYMFLGQNSNSDNNSMGLANRFVSPSGALNLRYYSSFAGNDFGTGSTFYPPTSPAGSVSASGVHYVIMKIEQLPWPPVNSVYFGRISLWLDPSSVPSESSPNRTFQQNVNSFSSLSFLNFRVGTTSSASFPSGTTVSFDEIKVGTSFADVAIPEPSAAAIGLLGLALLGLRRKV